MSEGDQGWLARLRQGLAKTRAGLVGLFSAARVDEALFEELETALVGADNGRAGGAAAAAAGADPARPARRADRRIGPYGAARGN